MLLTVLFWYVAFITLVGFVSDIIKYQKNFESQKNLKEQGQKIGVGIGTVLRFVAVSLFLYLVYQSGVI